jgi:hypothetical protein
MAADKRLKLSAVMFAVLWTAGMVWWGGNYSVAHILIMTIAGALAGLAWYLIMAKWQRRMLARQGNHDA